MKIMATPESSPENIAPELRKKRRFVSLLRSLREKVRQRIGEQAAATQPTQQEDQ